MTPWMHAIARPLSELRPNGLHTPWVSDWRPELVGTLVFIMRDEQVLLIHKKTGHGAGLINGPGGKLDPGESVVECAVREVAEEVGLTVHDASVGAELRFVERQGKQWLGFALTARDFSGEPVETPEARPFWCALDEIPYQQMWPDDAIWLPRLLANAEQDSDTVFVQNFLFDDGQLLAHEMDSAPSLWQAVGAGD